MIQEFPKDAHVTEGESVYFRVQVSGVPPPNLVWYHNGQEVVADYSTELGEDGSLKFPSAEARHTGVYQLVAINSAGSMEKEVKLFVHAEGQATPSMSRRVLQLKPIPVSDFGKYVADNHASNNRGFRDQYMVNRAYLIMDYFDDCMISLTCRHWTQEQNDPAL